MCRQIHTYVQRANTQTATAFTGASQHWCALLRSKGALTSHSGWPASQSIEGHDRRQVDACDASCTTYILYLYHADVEATGVVIGVGDGSLLWAVDISVGLKRSRGPKSQSQGATRKAAVAQPRYERCLSCCCMLEDVSAHVLVTCGEGGPRLLLLQDERGRLGRCAARHAAVLEDTKGR